MADNQHDRITTVDRYPASASYGAKALEFAALWDKPGRRAVLIGDADKYMTGALKHGSSVRILEKKYHNNELWCKVRAKQGGRLQEGWLKSVFLEEAGLAYFDGLR